MFTDCDVGVERDATASKPTRAAGRAASASFTVPVAPHTAYEIIGVDGNGGPPAVALTGPRGERLSAPADHPVVSAREVVVHDTRTDTTYVIVPSPAAGSWSLSAQPGSPAITGAHFATSLPPVSVRAKVTGTGRHRTLRYRIRRIPGQVVTFFERGARWMHEIGRVAGGGRGARRFALAPAAGGRRAVVAEVSQYGHPRAQVSVATFVAPPPPRLTRPGHLRATRRGSTLLISWRRVATAKAYAITIRTSDRRHVTTIIIGPRFKLLRFGSRARARVGVRALDSRKAGPAAVLSVCRAARVRALTTGPMLSPRAARPAGQKF
jgi:hypothetical protein